MSILWRWHFFTFCIFFNDCGIELILRAKYSRDKVDMINEIPNTFLLGAYEYDKMIYLIFI